MESYDVSLVHLDRAGGTPYAFWTTLFRRDGSATRFGGFGPDPGNTMTVRVPAGHYTAVSTVNTMNGTPPDGKPEPSQITTIVLAQPDLAVTKAMTVNLDARLGRPLSIAVPNPTANQVQASIGVYAKPLYGQGGRAVGGESFAQLFTARIGPDQHADGFMSYVGGQWAQGDGTNSPYLYSLHYPERGRMVNGYQRKVVDGELARIRVDVAATLRGSAGLRRVNTGIADYDVGDFGPYLPVAVPSTRTEYVNADAGVQRAAAVVESVSDDVSALTQADTYVAYQAGRTYDERWNRGVFGPRLSTPAGYRVAG